MDSNVKPQKNKKRKYIHLAILLISVVVTVLFVIYLNRLESLTDSFQNYGYIGVFLMGLIGSSAPIWPIPGSWAAFIAAGLGWNPFLVALSAGFGEGIGEFVGYMAGFGTQVAIEKIKYYPTILRWTQKRGSLIIFLFSAIPNFFVKGVGAAAGALRYPVWKYYLVSTSGKIIKSLIFAFAGKFLFSSVSDMVKGKYLWLLIGICIGVVALIFVIWYIWQRLRKARKSSSERTI
ncbi:MAG: VTT domain-containing protein [Chloroflexi bacterium]|nr:VTT domain-containing protein [Chloroflexota bacterium]